MLIDDPYAVFEQDRTDDQTGELRSKAIGLVGGVVLLVVVHTIREEDQGRSSPPYLGPPRRSEGTKPL